MMNGGGPAAGGRGPQWPRGSFAAQLTESARAELLACGTSVEHSAGERLIRQGASDTEVFLITEGVVKVTALSTNGFAGLLAVRVVGDVVGELAGLDGAPRIADVVAAGLVRSRRISGERFQAFLGQNPQAGLAVSRSVSQKLRWATRRRVDYSHYSVPIRVARLILDVAALHGIETAEGIDLGIALSQPELASLVGAAEPSVHRALRDMRKGSMVNTGYRKFIVTDMPALMVFADIPKEASGDDSSSRPRNPVS